MITEDIDSGIDVPDLEKSITITAEPKTKIRENIIKNSFKKKCLSGSKSFFIERNKNKILILFQASLIISFYTPLKTL